MTSPYSTPRPTQPSPNGPSLSPYPRSLRPARFTARPSLLSASQPPASYEFHSKTTSNFGSARVTPYPPSPVYNPPRSAGTNRIGARAARNPFDRLDSTSFDKFVENVTENIRNALKPPERPRRLRKVQETGLNQAEKDVGSRSVSQATEELDVFGQIQTVNSEATNNQPMEMDDVISEDAKSLHSAQSLVESSRSPVAMKLPLFAAASVTDAESTDANGWLEMDEDEDEDAADSAQADSTQENDSEAEEFAGEELPEFDFPAQSAPELAEEATAHSPKEEAKDAQDQQNEDVPADESMERDKISPLETITLDSEDDDSSENSNRSAEDEQSPQSIPEEVVPVDFSNVEHSEAEMGAQTSRPAVGEFDSLPPRASQLVKIRSSEGLAEFNESEHAADEYESTQQEIQIDMLPADSDAASSASAEPKPDFSENESAEEYFGQGQNGDEQMGYNQDNEEGSAEITDDSLSADRIPWQAKGKERAVEFSSSEDHFERDGVSDVTQQSASPSEALLLSDEDQISYSDVENSLARFDPGGEQDMSVMSWIQLQDTLHYLTELYEDALQEDYEVAQRVLNVLERCKIEINFAKWKMDEETEEEDEEDELRQSTSQEDESEDAAARCTEHAGSESEQISADEPPEEISAEEEFQLRELANQVLAAHEQKIPGGVQINSSAAVEQILAQDAADTADDAEFQLALNSKYFQPDLQPTDFIPFLPDSEHGSAKTRVSSTSSSQDSFDVEQELLQSPRLIVTKDEDDSSSEAHESSSDDDIIIAQPLEAQQEAEPDPEEVEAENEIKNEREKLDSDRIDSQEEISSQEFQLDEFVNLDETEIGDGPQREQNENENISSEPISYAGTSESEAEPENALEPSAEIPLPDENLSQTELDAPADLASSPPRVHDVYDPGEWNPSLPIAFGVGPVTSSSQSQQNSEKNAQAKAAEARLQQILRDRVEKRKQAESEPPAAE